MPQTDDWGGVAVQQAPQTDDWGGVAVQPTAEQSRPAYPTDPVSQQVFQQSMGGRLLDAVSGRLGTAWNAAKDDFSGPGLSDESVQSLTRVGQLANYNSQQSTWKDTVKGALVMPSAAVAAAGLTAADYANRTVQAFFHGTVALIGGEKGPENADAAFDYGVFGLQSSGLPVGEAVGGALEYLKVAGSMTADGTAIKSAMPSLKEVLAMPVKSEEGIAAEKTTPLVTKAPVINPMIDEKSGNLNLKYVNASDNVLAIQARARQAIADRDGVVISNNSTEEKGMAMVDKAAQDTADGIPPELANRMMGDPTNEVELYASRYLATQSAQEVFDLGEIAKKTGDARDFAAQEEAYDRMMSINGIAHDISATLARGTQSHQIIINGEEGVKALTGLSKEDAMRVAQTSIC